MAPSKAIKAKGTKKRSRSSAETRDSVDVDESASRPPKAGRVNRERRRKVVVDSDDSDPNEPQTRRLAPKLSPPPATTAAIEVSKAAVHTEPEREERSKEAAKDPEDARFDGSAYQTSRAVQKPFVVGYDLPFALLAQEFKREVQRLLDLINDATQLYLRDIKMGGLNDEHIPGLVSSPNSALEELYRMLFTYHWREYSSDLQSNKDLGFDSLLKGLISAFLVKKVFYTKTLPWYSPLNVFDNPSMTCVKEYLGALLAERNAEFEKLIRESSMNQVLDEKFQRTTVAEEASNLAFEMLQTLQEQFTFLAFNKSHASVWLVRLKENLKVVCKQALTLQAMMLASADEYTVIWPWGDSPFDISTMCTASGRFPPDGTKNLFPNFPGWKCTPVQKNMHSTFIAARAVVQADLTNPVRRGDGDK